MSKTHYEVEVWEHRVWLPLTDRQGVVIEYPVAKLAFDVKDKLSKPERTQVMQVFCKRTVIDRLSMVQTK